MDNVLWLLIGLAIGWMARWVYVALKTPKLPSVERGDALLSDRLISAQEQVNSLSAQLEQARRSTPKVVVKEKDRLEKIHGIGPVFAQRLNEAGVFSFKDLASLHPKRVTDIISPEEWQAIDPSGWIAQAVELSSTHVSQEEVTTQAS